MQKQSGTLIMAANSLGESRDIPPRSLEALRTANVVVFEEDKIARQCLKAAGIHRGYLRLSEHQEKDTLANVRESLSKGETVVYMSDQGTPNFADPGRELLKLAYELQVTIRVIPGANAVSAAISACPFNMEKFLYFGFLHRESNERRKQLREIAQHGWPTVILDAPYRRMAVLEDVLQVFGGERYGFIAIEIGNPGETYLWQPLGAMVSATRDFDKSVNFVLILAGTKD